MVSACNREHQGVMSSTYTSRPATDFERYWECASCPIPVLNRQRCRRRAAHVSRLWPPTCSRCCGTRNMRLQSVALSGSARRRPSLIDGAPRGRYYLMSPCLPSRTGDGTLTALYCIAAYWRRVPTVCPTTCSESTSREEQGNRRLGSPLTNSEREPPSPASSLTSLSIASTSGRASIYKVSHCTTHRFSDWLHARTILETAMSSVMPSPPLQKVGSVEDLRAHLRNSAGTKDLSGSWPAASPLRPTRFALQSRAQASAQEARSSSAGSRVPATAGQTQVASPVAAAVRVRVVGVEHSHTSLSGAQKASPC